MRREVLMKTRFSGQTKILLKVDDFLIILLFLIFIFSTSFFHFVLRLEDFFLIRLIIKCKESPNPGLFPDYFSSIKT